MASITGQAARKHWPGLSPEAEPYYNYRFEHVRQVERDAQRLIAVVGGDTEIILASVWTHDRFQPQYEGDRHAARAAEWVREHLASLGFPISKVPAVEYVVANHSNAPNTIPENELEARLVWDADKLSKTGALAVISFLCSIPAFPQTPVSHVSAGRQLN
jgi:HD superfamily phosphodiesterase